MKLQSDLPNNEKIYFYTASLAAFANMVETETDKQTNEITWKQYLLLRTVNQNKQPRTLKELAENFGTSYQNIKELALRLENKGFVTISNDINDKKKLFIKITDQGKKHLDAQEINDKELFKKALSGISDAELKNAVDTLTKISINLKGSSIITIIDYEGKPIKASTFRKCKLFPRKKNRPRYQLYASIGSTLEVSGVNRHIIGFYNTEEQIDFEVEAINEARKRKDLSYTIQYSVPVYFDFSNMPILKDSNIKFIKKPKRVKNLIWYSPTKKLPAIINRKFHDDEPNNNERSVRYYHDESVIVLAYITETAAKNTDLPYNDCRFVLVRYEEWPTELVNGNLDPSQVNPGFDCVIEPDELGINDVIAWAFIPDLASNLWIDTTMALPQLVSNEIITGTNCEESDYILVQSDAYISGKNEIGMAIAKYCVDTDIKTGEEECRTFSIVAEEFYPHPQKWLPIHCDIHD